PERTDLAELLAAAAEVEPAAVGLLEDVEAATEIDAPPGVGPDPSIVTARILREVDLDPLFGGALHDVVEHPELLDLVFRVLVEHREEVHGDLLCRVLLGGEER